MKRRRRHPAAAGRSRSSTCSIRTVSAPCSRAFSRGVQPVACTGRSCVDHALALRIRKRRSAGPRKTKKAPVGEDPAWAWARLPEERAPLERSLDAGEGAAAQEEVVPAAGRVGPADHERRSLVSQIADAERERVGLVQGVARGRVHGGGRVDRRSWSCAAHSFSETSETVRGRRAEGKANALRVGRAGPPARSCPARVKMPRRSPVSSHAEPAALFARPVGRSVRGHAP